MCKREGAPNSISKLLIFTSSRILENHGLCLPLIFCVFTLRIVRNNPYSTALLTDKDERRALSPVPDTQVEIIKWKSLYLSPKVSPAEA